MKTRKIKQLIELVKEYGISELEVKSGEESVRISCQPSITTGSSMTWIQSTNAEVPGQPPSIPAQNAPPIESTSSSPNEHTLRSPMVGTIYLAPAPGAKPFVAAGDRVEIGDTLCMIEAMKMFNKIESDVRGIVSARLVENQQPVEYDQPLFIIDMGENEHA